jgi:hypothetical protein
MPSIAAPLSQLWSVDVRHWLSADSDSFRPGIPRRCRPPFRADVGSKQFENHFKVSLNYFESWDQITQQTKK